MEYGIWNSEPFLREIELSKRSALLIEVIAKYAKFRNILIDGKRLNETVDFILDEIINIPFLKLYTIRYALTKFTDENNQNISAAIILAMIKKAYQTEAHKAILKRWDVEDQSNRLAPLNDMQKEELNKKARFDSFQIISNDPNLSFDNPNWLNAIKYLAKDMDYKPDPKQVERFHKIARDVIFEKLDKDKTDVTLSRDDHKKTLKELAQMVADQIEGSEVEGRIVNLRRKLILQEYINNQK